MGRAADKNAVDVMNLQLMSMLDHLNPDGGMPYAPGMPSFSEPTLLTILAFVAAGEAPRAQAPVEWALRNRNGDGSIGLNREFPDEGKWNTPLLAIAMHHIGRTAERDAALHHILQSRSLTFRRSAENDLDTQLTGWPWVAQTFGWVEPTSWALLALRLAGKDNHPRALEGRRFLEDRCIPEGGWNYGNKVLFNNTLMPFWDTTALALLALGESNTSLANKNLDLLERTLPEMRSLSTCALVCLCLALHGRGTDELRRRIQAILAEPEGDSLNLAHSAMGWIALSQRKVLTP